MEIYLDANATTPVLPQARQAALFAMADAFGNPSSVHGSGMRARVLLDEARATARRVLGAASGQLLFTSGATEGIQTAVLSAMKHLRQRRNAGEAIPGCVLYGATEHKAVPEALNHWNNLLGLGLQVLAIPVGRDGRHDLEWLRAHVGEAGLVCTMAANNETGVISDLDGIAGIMKGSGALWLVDSVQALGKVELHLRERGIDYAPFSGHKLYAPKGVGMLYVREGAPFTPLLAGGGQESALRSGTENMAGIAALGAVLKELETGTAFASAQALHGYRAMLAQALREAFPGVVFNAPFEISLPTTLNVSVPGLSANTLLNLLDAGGIRASGGSACGASKAMPSYVLQAMGLPEWQTASAVRLSFGAAERLEMVSEACRRFRACGDALRESCRSPLPATQPMATEPITRFVFDGACCYVAADAAARECVIIDPQPELAGQLAQWLRCRGCMVKAVLDTHGHASSSPIPREAIGNLIKGKSLGWPQAAEEIRVGAYRLTRVAAPGPMGSSAIYLMHDAKGPRAAFTGNVPAQAASGSSGDGKASASSKALEEAIGRDTLLLPSHDENDRFATTLAIERAPQGLPERVEVNQADISQWLGGSVLPILVDVREAYEERMSPLAATWPAAASGAALELVPLSVLVNRLPKWRALADDVRIVFCCRAGNRSAQAARTLRRLGHAQSYSLAGGLTLLSAAEGVPSRPRVVAA